MGTQVDRKPIFDDHKWVTVEFDAVITETTDRVYVTALPWSGGDQWRRLRIPLPKDKVRRLPREMSTFDGPTFELPGWMINRSRKLRSLFE